MTPADARRVLPWVMIVVAVALIVTHFVLESGGDSPDWILLLATVIALGATFVASNNRKGR